MKSVRHEDQLSVVDHLDELRSRLLVAVAAFVVAFGLTTWQSDLVLEILNAPLPGGQLPITLSPTEPFVTTLKNAAYAALLLTLPVVLYQAYAFFVPAFSPKERKVVAPLLLMVPVLFIAGVVFCYLVVLPPALDFLLSFNASEFNTQLRAKDYYDFMTLTMLALGLGFQVPVGVLALTRLGVVTAEGLRHSRRYAIVAIAVLAALLPTLDPVTLVLEMVPLLVLYEISIQLARVFAPVEGGESSALYELSRGQPRPGAGARAVSRRPVGDEPVMLAGPFHWAATMNSVVSSAPPSMQAKQPRSTAIVCSTSPPARTRTQRLLGTSAYQTASSASMQIPSGTPSPRSAQTRRLESEPSEAMSKAVSRLA